MRHLVHRRASAAWAAVLVAVVFVPSRPAHGQSREMHSSLAGQLRMFQLRVISGRIAAMGPASSQNLTSNYMGNQRRERLSIDLAGGLPNVSYERTAPDERMTIDIEKGNKVSIHVAPRSTSDHALIVFTQPAEGAMSLTVTTANESKTYAAATLWHLLLCNQAVCREHLIPLLEVMRPTWQLAEQAQEVENELCRLDTLRIGVDQSRWQKNLAALASARYVERERAEHQLLAAGAVVLPFLRSQERSALDAEQGFRIRRLIRSLAAGGDEDTPDRVTAWQTADPRIWYALLERANPAVRKTAADRLTRILDTAIDFDPAAADEERQQQLDRLRDKFRDVLDPPLPPADRSAERSPAEQSP